jgi:hypothetical protein
MSSNTNSPTGGSHFISLQQAIEMTSLYRAEKENILAPKFRDQGILPICETFDRNAFDSLLAESDCIRIRTYFCMDTNLNVKLVIVGVNSNNEDILPAGNTLSGGEEIVEEGQRCPPYCPPPSPLNG